MNPDAAKNLHSQEREEGGTDTREDTFPCVKGRGRPRKPQEDPRKEQKDQKSIFIGARIPASLHQRLYRAKAFLEYSTGKFYGMGKLLSRVLGRGLTQLEREFDKNSNNSNNSNNSGDSNE